MALGGRKALDVEKDIPWVICLWEAGSTRPVLVPEGLEIDADDPAYEQDVHILPWHNPDGISLSARCPFAGHVTVAQKSKSGGVGGH